jgi:hypothetical protein
LLSIRRLYTFAIEVRRKEERLDRIRRFDYGSKRRFDKNKRD